MFAGLFAFSARAKQVTRVGVNKFTFCEVIDTEPKMRLAVVKSRVFDQLRLKPCTFEVEGISWVQFKDHFGTGHHHHCGRPCVIRPVPKHIDRSLRQKSKQARQSLNEATLDALSKGLGLADVPPCKFRCPKG